LDNRCGDLKVLNPLLMPPWSRTNVYASRVSSLTTDGSVRRGAEQFNCGWSTVKRCAERYAAMGEAGTTARSSYPTRWCDGPAIAPCKGRPPALGAAARAGGGRREACHV